MRLSTALHLTLVALLLAGLGVGAAASPAAAQQSSQDADDYRQTITIRLTDDGDAEWTVEHRRYLADEADVDAFESWAQAVRDGRRDAGYDPATLERFAARAEYGTDRSMSIEDAGWDEHRIEADPETDGQYGVVTYSFTWTNFAAQDGRTLTVADTFASADGTWFPAIDDHQRLVIEAPAYYNFETVPHGLDDGALVWDGPHEFAESDFDIVIAQGPLAVALGLLPLVGLAVFVAGVGVAAWYLLTQRRDLLPWIDPDDSGSDAGEEPDRVPDPAADPVGASATPDRSDPSSSDGGETLAFDEPSDDVDVELLSDEERVHRLLRKNGGRMKQASIVKETGWSNAKVSQLLSQMDDDDEIEKLRIGRENLITLPEVDPTEIE